MSTIFEEWWERYAKEQGYEHMDESICELCKQAAYAGWRRARGYSQ